MQIRKIKPAEIRELSRLHRKIFEESFNYYNQKQKEEALELWTPERIEKRLENPNYVIFVAIENGNLIGFIAFRIRSSKCDTYINWMGVNSQNRGRGIGGELVKKWLKYVGENTPEITIFRASTSKKENMGFYKKLGFSLAEEKVTKSGMKKYSLVK